MYNVILFQILLLDYNSLARHLPYAEFSAAVLVGLIMKNHNDSTTLNSYPGINSTKGPFGSLGHYISVLKIFNSQAYQRINLFFVHKKVKFIWLILILYIIISINFAFNDVNNYPSYNLIEDNLSTLNGKILALNPNSFILIQNMPLNSTAENIYHYYYFNYDCVVDSKIEEYEEALKDGFFNYATISSLSPYTFPRYQRIENLVRKHYCPILLSNKSNGIDIYKRCD